MTVLIIALVYLGLGWAGLNLATINTNTSPVWPVTGFAIFAVYAFGRRGLLAVAIGAFVVNFFTPIPLKAVVGIAFGNTIEAMLGAYLLKRILNRFDIFAFQTQTFAIVLASIAGAICSALMGTLSLVSTDVVYLADAGRTWTTWWIGNFLGGLIVTPVCLFLYNSRAQFVRFFTREALVKFAGCLILSFAALAVVFLYPPGKALLFLLFPVLLLVAHWAGRWGLWLVAPTLSFLCVVFTAKEMGPFVGGTLNQNLVHLQLFLAAIGLTALTISGIIDLGLIRRAAQVMMLCWLFFGALFFYFETEEVKSDLLRFSRLTEEIRLDVLHRARIYQDAVRAGVGLYAASGNVSYSQWNAFFQSQDLSTRYPGIAGVGVIWPVKAKDLKSFEQRARVEVVDYFRLHSVDGSSFEDLQGSENEHYVIKYIAPLDVGGSALGLVVSSEANRRVAADMARDSGLPAISESIRLVHPKTVGFLLYVPIYKKGTTPSTVEQRREALMGWVHAPIIASGFFAGLSASYANEIEMYVFEGSGTDGKFVYSSNGEKPVGKFELLSSLSIGQRNFTIAWRRGAGFVSSHDTILAWVGLFGALASVFLVSLISALESINDKAQKIAEELTEHLRRSEERFRLIVQDVKDYAIYMLDPSGRVVTWNEGAERAMGYREDEILGKHFSQFYEHADVRADVPFLAIESARRTGQYSEEGWRVRENGSKFWASVLLTRISDSKGNILGFSKITRDMTLLRESELAKAETLNKLMLVTNNVPALISYWDKNERCQFANNPYARWHGVDSEKIVGMTMSELIGEELYKVRKPLIQTALQGKAQFLEAHLPERNTRELSFLNVHYIPHQENGEVRGFFVLVTDVTALSKAKLEAIEEKKRAIAAAEVKSQFLANMSHEIRTPLSAITGMTELLMGMPKEQAQEECLEIIEQSADNLLKLVNDILDLSKAEAGRLNLERIEFDPRSIINECIKSLSYLATPKGISLKAVFEAEITTALIGDPVRLRQVFMNLVNNAIKFTHAGQVTVRMKAVSEDSVNQQLRFEVEDSGEGIPHNMLDKMFEPFVQVDASTTRRFGGTGLGLSICRQIVDLMGGKIGVMSNEGAGSLFWLEINFPRGRDLNVQDPKFTAAIATSRLKSIAARILLAEDNAFIQKVTVAQLEKHGCQVDIANNGNEALAALNRSTYDLLILDCHMPDLDGYKTTTLIRENTSANFQKIPIIALTANAFQEERERCLALGMSDFLAKPVRESELIAVINKWLPRIDLAAIDRLRAIRISDGPSLVSNLLGLFLDSSESSLAGIEAAVKAKNNSDLYQSTHRLKSGAAQIGAKRMVDICLQLERIGKNINWNPQADELCLVLQDEYRILTTQLAAYLEPKFLGESEVRSQLHTS